MEPRWGAAETFWPTPCMHDNAHSGYHSAASFVQTDDLESFTRVQKGLRSQGTDWVDISRGLGEEDLLEGHREQLAVEHHWATVHEHVAHVARLGRVHKVRHRVRRRGREMRAAEVQHHEVGAPPHRDRAELLFQAQGARASRGGELQHLARGQDIRAVARLLDQRGEAHLREHVEAVVARRPVRAQRHPAPGLEHLRDSRYPAPQLEIRRGTVHDVRALRREPRDLVLVHPDAMRHGRPGARDPHRVEVGDLLEPRGAEHRLPLDDRLRGVGVELRTVTLCEIARRAQQRARAARHEAGSEAPPQPSARRPVPAPCQALRFRERRIRRFGELEWGALRVRVHQTLPRRRPNAAPVQCLERRAGVVHGFHVEDRRRATEQQLGRAEQGGPVHRLLGVRRLERPDTPRQPVLEPQVVPEAAEQRLAEMHVGLNQPGHDEAARAIAHDGLRTLPSGRPAGGGRTGGSLGVEPPHGRDPAIPHDHIPPLHAPFDIVQQHVAAPQDQLRGSGARGAGRPGPPAAQVVTRGGGGRESSARSK